MLSDKAQVVEPSSSSVFYHFPPISCNNSDVNFYSQQPKRNGGRAAAGKGDFSRNMNYLPTANQGSQAFLPSGRSWRYHCLAWHKNSTRVPIPQKRPPAQDTAENRRIKTDTKSPPICGWWLRSGGL